MQNITNEVSKDYGKGFIVTREWYKTEKFIKEHNYIIHMLFQYFNINDKIVEKSISSLAKVTDIPENSPIIVGGMAIQMHCSSDKEYLRSTSDIDLVYKPEINSYNDFSNGIGGKIKEQLDETEFQSQLKKIKHRDKYVIKIMNGQGNNAKELFHMHIDKSPFTKNENIAKLDQLLMNTAVKYAVDNNYVFLPRPELIIARKLNRLKRKLNSSESTLEKSIYNNAEHGKWGNVAKIPLHPWLDLIITQQNKITNEKDKKYYNYHINKDLYDLCLLSHQIEGKPGFLNKAFYLQAKNEIDTNLIF